jgi:hypothetical protein
MSRLNHLITLFGSQGAIAEALGTHKGIVSRWFSPDPAKARGLGLQHQLALIRLAKERELPLAEVLWALNPPRCPCCAAILNNDLRREFGATGMLSDAKAKPAAVPGR